MFIWAWVQHQLAGVWSMAWHWGTGIGLIVLLLAAALASESVPIVGKWLKDVRKDLVWGAVALALLLVGMYIGAEDEKKICKARTTIVVQTVTKVVKSVKTPKLKKQDDPYDNPNN